MDKRIPAENEVDGDNNGDGSYGNGYGNGGGVDIYDNALDIGAIKIGCTGTIGMVGVLPCAALLSGLLLRKKRNSIDGEETEE